MKAQSSGARHIAVVDVETTGLSPWRHDRIVEIAVVLLSPDGEIRDEYESLVNPGRDVGPTSIHGISASDLIDAPPFAAIAGDVVALLRHAFVLAGHNVSFDRNFLIGEFERLPATFPEMPLFCTCRQLGRQNLAACCEELGIVLDDEGAFHSALFDARATARIVARLLAEDPGLLSVPPAPVEWPELPVGLARPVPRRAARERRASPPGFLQRIASRSAHDTDTSPPDVLTYLGLLDRVLEDRIVVPDEEEALLTAVERLGLSKPQVEAAHASYLWHLAALALADGHVSERERADLEIVAHLLGIDRSTLDSLLAQTRGQLDRLGAQLAPVADLSGKRVCFTGELQARIDGEPVTRAVAQQLAAQAGLVVANSVTKKLDLLVAADPNTLSSKGRKARQYGIRIVAEAAFWRMLGVAVE
ncbi:MAG TPA: exonuclease domain-containing protein [Gammaproteobacteria bacterium]